MAVNLNINPYYDDFDEFKNFHQLLFKPGYAVQARELTQLQTIIQDQIKKFGGHIFKQGSVVIPGNSFADTNTPYVRLQNSFNGQEVNGAEFIGNVIVGATTGIRAVVRTTAPATTADPLTFYLSYLSGSSTGEVNLFQPGEEIFLETNSTLRATVQPTLPTGTGSLAFIKTGVFFVNGRFVTIKDSTTIISKYTTTPSCRVLLKITEEIVTQNEDDTLLDPASGSYNFAAPGADRLKVSLTLTSLPLTTEIDDNYVEIMRFNEGVLEEHSRYPKYSELEKSLARRTYDESGDYIVEGFGLKVREHLKTNYNDGVYTPIQNGNRTKFVYELENGKAYIKGFEVEKLARTLVTVDKARTSDHVKIKDYSLLNSYGQYIYVTNLVNLPNFNFREEVELWSAYTGGVRVGKMRVYAIDLLEGDASSGKGVYKLFYHDLSLFGSNRIANAGRVVFAGGTAKVLTKYNLINTTNDFDDAEDATPTTIVNSDETRTAIVHRFVRSESALYVYKHDAAKDIPTEGDFIKGTTAGSGTATVKSIVNSIQIPGNALQPLFVDALKSIQNSNFNYGDLSYTVWALFKFTTNNTGYGEITITAGQGKFVQPDTGILVASYSGGIINPNLFVAPSNNKLEMNGTLAHANQTISVLTQIRKEAISPKTKTLSEIQTITKSPANTIYLDKCDIYELISVVDANGNDVTTSFILDNGQRDYYYDIGRLKLIGALPTSNLTIKFRYFEHSQTGDFFSVDSYASLAATPADFINVIGKIPKYRSTNTSQIYDLKTVLDFRPRVGDSGFFSSSGEALPTNPSAAIGASLSNFPVLDSILLTPVQYFVPRIDSIVVNKNGQVEIIQGTPSERPLKPAISNEAIELYSAFVPPYTDLASNVVVQQSSTRRYTMQDIARLESRVNSVERLSILNSMESGLIRTEVADATTGLNRFKSGYLVDNFSNPFLICDKTVSANSSSFYDKKFGPRKEGFVAAFDLLGNVSGGSTNYKLENGQLSLPYTEVSFIEQKTSTNTTTLNPFSAISWEGILTLGREYDTTVQAKNNTNTTNPEIITDDSTDTTGTPPRGTVTEPSISVNAVIIPGVSTLEEVATVITAQPSYTTSIATADENENDTVVFTIATSGVLAGTTLYWTLTGDGITETDFDNTGGFSNALSGTVSITSDPGSATVTKKLVADNVTEGPETLTFTLRKDSLSGTVVDVQSVVINDTSFTAETYNLAQSSATVTEGNAVTFTLTTTGVANGTTLYWTVDGPGVAQQDFTDDALSGTVTIASNQAVVVRTLTLDALQDYNDNFTIYFRKESVTGTVVATASVIVIDATPVPTYSVSTAGGNNFSEGSTVFYNINTTNVANGTVLYWSAITNATELNPAGPSVGDFVDGVASGTVTINNNSALVTKVLKEDLETEGPESITFYLRLDSQSGIEVAAHTINVVDTSLSVATYDITADNSVLTEGGTVNYFVTTTNVPNGTVLYWQLSGATGSTITTADFVGGQLTGQVSVSNNSAIIVKQVAADAATEGTEYVTLSLKTDSQTGPLVASLTLPITDTSTTIPTYAINQSNSYIDEGLWCYFQITTTGISNGEVLYWTIDGDVVSGDFTDVLGLANSVTIVDNQASVTKQVSADSLTEGPETFNFKLRTSSTSGPVVATAVVVINDTSTAPVLPYYNVYSNVQSWWGTGEGYTATFNIETSGVAAGTTLYWEIVGDVTSADFSNTGGYSNALSGSFALPASGFYSIEKAFLSDQTTEGPESFTFRLKTSPEEGLGIVGTVSAVVNDYSTTPATYAIASNVASVNEGQTITWTLTTTNLSPGTTVPWTIGNLQQPIPDFTDTVQAGQFTVGAGGTATLTKTVLNDNITEGEESYTLFVRESTGSTNGVYDGLIFASSTVRIVDTSTSKVTVISTKDVVSEGTSVTFNISVSPAPTSNTTFYWSTESIYSNTSTGPDFQDGVESGSVVIGPSGNGSVTRVIVADNTTEGEEAFNFKVYAEPNGFVLGNTFVVIDDTSRNPPAPPEQVKVTMVRNNIGLTDLYLANGSIDNSLITINVTTDDYNTFHEMTNGKVFKSLSSIDQWATKAAAALVMTAKQGSAEWDKGKENILQYLESQGVQKRVPGQPDSYLAVAEILGNAYDRVVSSGIKYGGPLSPG